jgi:hypothetical protein
MRGRDSIIVLTALALTSAASAAEFQLGQIAPTALRPGDVIEVPNAPFVRDYGEVGRAVEFGRVLFSPSGNLLAFTLSQITSGDPEQAWVFDIAKGSLQRVTDVPVKGEVGFSVSSLRWQHDDVLIVNLDRINWKDHSGSVEPQKLRFHAGTVSREPNAREADAPAPPITSPSGAFEIRFSERSSRVVEVKTKRTLYKTDEVLDGSSWATRDTFIIVRDHGHGMLTLQTAKVDPSRHKTHLSDVRSGSWELQGYAVDASAGLVYFPYIEPKEPVAVVAFDVAKRSPTRVLLVGPYPGTIAASPKGALAFVANGCVPPSASGVIPDGLKQKVPRTLCVLRH